ncbi:MAG: hypothetical protein ACFE9L_08350 [Candidatus Hodarchaeota archaeon]
MYNSIIPLEQGRIPQHWKKFTLKIDPDMIVIITDWNCVVLRHECHRIIHLSPKENKIYFTPKYNMKSLDHWFKNDRKEA